MLADYWRTDPSMSHFFLSPRLPRMQLGKMRDLWLRSRHVHDSGYTPLWCLNLWRWEVTELFGESWCWRKYHLALDIRMINFATYTLGS